MIQHILVPLDGSQLAELALPYAVQMGYPNRHITLLSVIDIPEVQAYSLFEVPMTLRSGDYNEFVANAERSARDYLQRIADQLSTDSQLKVDTEYFVGEPASVILDRARKLNIDAIVMSTHGRSGFSRWLFGSITQKVMSAMPCPVFVVPGGRHDKTATQERAAVATS
jgi:nucleotide-binding universal stress UspA family protein